MKTYKLDQIICRVTESNHIITKLECKDKYLGTFQLEMPSEKIETLMVCDDIEFDQFKFIERSNPMKVNPNKDKYYFIGPFICKLQGRWYLKGKSKKYGKVVIHTDREDLKHCPRTHQMKYKNALQDDPNTFIRKKYKKGYFTSRGIDHKSKRLKRKIYNFNPKFDEPI